MEKTLKPIKPILKITLYGPESTGKTTLCKQLANYFNAAWVPEFARNYLQEKLDKHQQNCELSDMLPIAVGQTKLENEALATAKRFLFCDTNVMVTKVFSDIYYGFCPLDLETAAKVHDCDLYFLTNIDIPWEDDGLRDKPNDRKKTLALFEKALQEYKKPYILLSGNKEERFKKAVQIVQDLEKAKKAGLTSFDYVSLYHQNKNIGNTIQQIQYILKGTLKINVLKPATIGDGVFKLIKNQEQEYIDFFEKKLPNIIIQKFVPASGAATRMFQFLYEFLSQYKIEEETINAYINRKNDRLLPVFLVGLEKFPFFKSIYNLVKQTHPKFNSYTQDFKNYLFIKTMLTDTAFAFGNKPKAVLPFHVYQDKTITPIEEQIIELLNCTQNNNTATIHFTVSKEHLLLFEQIVANTKYELEQQYNQKINVTYSFQDPNTDSITIGKNQKPIYDTANQILFKPGGHGALLYNLNTIHADLVFIKNIDNVSQNKQEQITQYNKILAGILLEKQEQIFSYLTLLEQQEIDKNQISEIVNYIETVLLLQPPINFAYFKKKNKIKFLQEILNRPIRVCGMVKNENEPGGGPFWVTQGDGTPALQIIESAQFDVTNLEQIKILQSSTHFNPVYLVCGIKNYKQIKFDLLQFTNPNTGFVVQKSNLGTTYASYELPGLWNGSMANWISIFVEVPTAIFNPVKTVNDLLKPNHQPLQIGQD